MGSSKPLAGISVMVTRPVHQAAGLCHLIEKGGGRALRFPTLKIEPPKDVDPVSKVLRSMDQVDWLVFVSVNAVYYAQKACDNRLNIPRHVKVAAIGTATERALLDCGIRGVVVPEGRYDTEAVLGLAEMRHVAGQRFLIVRGQGGRPLLGDTLIQRGAEVGYAEVYRRCCPSVDTGSYLAQWERHGVDAVTAFSGESLRNLVTLLGRQGMEWAACVPLIVISERVAGQAKANGFKKVVLAENALDSSLFATLCNLFDREGHGIFDGRQQ
jgi:uroporphyrinogen-III synthase